MFGSSAERAAVNGEFNSWTSTNSTHTTAIGSPLIAITPTSTARDRSETTITDLRGYRSAMPDSNGPPTRSGRKVRA